MIKPENRFYSPFDKFPTGVARLDKDQPPTQPLGLDLKVMSDEELLRFQLMINQELSWRKDNPEPIDILIPNDKPILIVGLGDLHYGGDSTDYTHLIDFRDETSSFSENVYYILVGDLIEGFGAHKTIDLRTTIPDYQIEALKKFIQPIKHKVIGMVANYFAHEGHIADYGSIDLWAILAKQLGVRKINNGSVLRLVSPSVTTSIAVMHDPGKTSSKDPVHGNRIMTQYLNTDVGFSAHTHRAGVELETRYEGRSANSPTNTKAYIAIGTAKGSNTLLPQDMFGVRKSMTPRPSKLTQMLIIRPLEGNRKQLYPGYNSAQTLYAFSAYQLLAELAGQANMQKEVAGEIRAKSERIYGKPTDTIQLRPDLSETLQATTSVKEEKLRETEAIRIKRKLSKHDIEIGNNQSASFDKPYADVYGRLVYDLVSPMPVAIHFPANVYFGSASSDTISFKKYLSQIAGPYDFKIWLRNILDPSVAGLDDRKIYLNTVGQWIMNGKSLGLLLSKSITAGGWKKHTRNLEEVISNLPNQPDQQTLYDSLPIPPATFLHDLTGVNLLNNLSWVSIRMKSNKENGEDKYDEATIVVIADAGERVSSAKPLWGLESLYLDLVRPTPPKPTIVGGNSPGSGIGQIGDAIFISPGWWSMATMGRSNIPILGGPPEKSIILQPTQNNGIYRFPISNLTDTIDTMDALTIRAGIDNGFISAKKLVRRKGKR